MDEKILSLKLPTALAQAIEHYAQATGADEAAVVIDILAQAFGFSSASATAIVSPSPSLCESSDRVEAQETKFAIEPHLAQMLDPIFSISPDLIFIQDRLGRCTYVNSACCKVWQIDRSYFLGKTFQELGFATETSTRLLTQQAAVFKTGQSISGEMCLSIHQMMRAYEYTISPIYSSKGTANAAVLVARDQTERQQAESKLLAAEQKYQALLDAAIDAILISDFPTGQILEANWSTTLRFGYTHRELLQMSIFDLAAPTDAADRAALLHKLQTDGNFSFESVYHHKNGAAIPVAVNAQVIEYDGQLAIQSFVSDIRERKHHEIERQQAKLALHQSEEKFRQLAENIQDVFWIGDALTGRLLYISPAYEQVWQRTCDSLYATPYSFLEAVYPADRDIVIATFAQHKQGQNTDVEYRITQPNGEIRWIHDRSFPIRDATGKIYRYAGIARDITDRKQADAKLHSLNQELEQRVQSRTAELSYLNQVLAHEIVERQQLEASLKASEAQLNDILNHANAAIARFQMFADGRWIYDYYSAGCELVFGYTAEAMMQGIWQSRILPNDRESVIHSAQADIFAEKPTRIEYQFLHADGTVRWISSCLTSRRDAPDRWTVIAVDTDITDKKCAEALLHQQAERERLFSTISYHIHRSLNLEEILQTTVAEVHQLLKVDRVLIYRTVSDGTSKAIAEAVSPEFPSILGLSLSGEMGLTDNWRLDQGGVQAIADIYSDEADLAPCLMECLEQSAVRAALIVPIFYDELALDSSSDQRNSNLPTSDRPCADQTLWGLLIAHQCQTIRSWQAWEIDLLSQVTMQLAIAIQQFHLYEQVQRVRVTLEQQVQERTAELTQALSYEAILKHITDQARDGLDEHQILQTVTEALGQSLNLSGCHAALYDLAQKNVTITEEWINDLPSLKGQTLPLESFEGLPELMRGECVQFCELADRNSLSMPFPLSMLACPVFDDQHILGSLWLFRAQAAPFTAPEIGLVQQMANQCAIALRQSRLFHATQQQLAELERLNNLKDDFLSTISHELRTPISNIRLATRMLEISLTQVGCLSQEEESISRYLTILETESQRESTLINDLLDLTRLNAERPTRLTAIAPQHWIAHLVEAFLERTDQQQHLELDLPADLPLMTTDLEYLERVLVELLNNACKYTPAGETIAIRARAIHSTVRQTGEKQLLHPPREPSALSELSEISTAHASRLQICVSNSGVEIPADERDRIFDKFYRIPSSDPWRHSGTGLGLTLAKKLIEQLGGSIAVTSQNNVTEFIVELPIAQPADSRSTPNHRPESDKGSSI